MKKVVIAATAAASLVGCATSSINYTPPARLPIVNSATIDQPFDTVWDRLVKNLSSDFFIINNIDKASRLINVSFSSQRPSEYVDCGRSDREFNGPQGKQNYSYNAADSSRFTTTLANGVPVNVFRATRLEGRTNIYVAPEGSGTLITVNTKYVINLTMTGATLDGKPAGSQNFVWDFSTKEPYNSNDADPVLCNARGTIESRVLGYAK